MSTEWAEVGQAVEEKVTVSAQSRATHFSDPANKFNLGGSEESNRYKCQIETVQVVPVDSTADEKDNNESGTISNSSSGATTNGEVAKYVAGGSGGGGAPTKDDRAFDENTTTTIEITSIDSRTTEDDLSLFLNHHFGQCYLKLLRKQREEGQYEAPHRGKGFVEFNNRDAAVARQNAERCMAELPTVKYALWNSVLSVKWAKPNTDQGRGGGGGGFGGARDGFARGSDDIRNQSYGRDLAQSVVSEGDRNTYTVSNKYGHGGDIGRR